MILVQSHNSEVRCQQIPNVCMYVSMNIWILHKWDNPLNQLGLYVCMCMYVYVLYDVLYKECVKWDMNMVDEAVKRYVWMNVCTYVCMYVCMYVCIFGWLITNAPYVRPVQSRATMHVEVRNLDYFLQTEYSRRGRVHRRILRSRTYYCMYYEINECTYAYTYSTCIYINKYS